jgi:hypothetical protein
MWARAWGGIYWSYGKGVAMDGSGNAYVTGWFSGVVDFDPGPKIDEHIAYWDSAYAFLSKFDPNGDFLWCRTWGGSYGINGEGVAMDGSGNPYVTGWFSGGVDFDPGPGVDKHSSDLDVVDAFLCKYPPDGVW